YDKEEDSKMDIEEEEPEEDPVDDDDNDVEEEDEENKDADIEKDDDAEIIFPYEEVNDELEVKEASVEPEAEGSDVELEAGEPDGVPEATIGTGSKRPFAVRDFLIGFYEAGESST
nr:hypothetical protein [Tanacetum cinerariifolium]